MYDIISAFQFYTISVDVYFPFHCTLWMACFTFLLILCYCCCAHDNDVSHTLHREWGVTDALIDAVKNAAKIPLNTMRIKAASALSDKLGGVLAEVLALIRQREGLKAMDLTVQVRPLVGEYIDKVEADRQYLVRRIAEEDARISAESTIMFKTDARSA